jgi:hypothetical protein
VGSGQEPADNPTTSAGTSSASGTPVTVGDKPPASAGSGQEPTDGGDLTKQIEAAKANTEAKLAELKSQDPNNMSTADMFEMQKLMNKLSQLSEMSTSIANASNSALASMARNVKS